MSNSPVSSNPLVQRLHGKCGLHTRGYASGECVLCDAADEIEKLDGRLTAVLDIYEMKKAEIERLRASLERAMCIHG